MKNYLRRKGQTDSHTFRVLCSIHGAYIPKPNEVTKKILNDFNIRIGKLLKKYPKFNFDDCNTWGTYKNKDATMWLDSDAFCNILNRVQGI